MLIYFFKKICSKNLSLKISNTGPLPSDMKKVEKNEDTEQKLYRDTEIKTKLQNITNGFAYCFRCESTFNYWPIICGKITDPYSGKLQKWNLPNHSFFLFFLLLNLLDSTKYNWSPTAPTQITDWIREMLCSAEECSDQNGFWILAANVPDIQLSIGFRDWTFRSRNVHGGNVEILGKMTGSGFCCFILQMLKKELTRFSVFQLRQRKCSCFLFAENPMQADETEKSFQNFVI
jgi:hypothetical protein